MSLQEAVELARRQDPWLQGNRYSQQAMDDMGVASAALPDPKVSLAFANLPTNTWDFDQEPMTQFKVGVTQMFLRGDQRALRQKQWQQMSQQMPYQRADRLAQIQWQVSRLWLDSWLAQESVRLINHNRYLFEQMSEITQNSYSSAVGRTRQQDVIRAQLELTHLEDRLTRLQQQRDSNLAELWQWLGGSEGLQPSLELPEQLPSVPLSIPADVQLSHAGEWDLLAQHLQQHPSVLVLEQKISVTTTEVDLAKQKYQPEWGINASYGYREDDPMGNERADFFSVGVSFDVPLFTGNRQDKEVSAAVAKTESVKTEKWLRLRSLISSYESARVQWLRVNQRQDLYQSTLLPQAHEQAEASLTAYTNDNGDFAEVMRARIAELNAEIDALGIAVQRQKIIAQLNYIFAGGRDE